MRELALGLAILLAAVALVVVLHRLGDGRSEERRLGGAAKLAGSVEPLAEAFNRWSDRPRLLAVVPPASPLGLAGAQSLQQVLAEDSSPLAVLVVWMEALPSDITRKPAPRVAILAGDPRVVQFYDSTQVAGRAVGELVGWPEDSLSWDIYLFFETGATWGETPPRPVAWFHQRVEGAPEHFRIGIELTDAVRRTVRRLGRQRGVGDAW